MEQEEYIRDQHRWWEEREKIDVPNEYERLASELLASSSRIEFLVTRSSGKRFCRVTLATGEWIGIDSTNVTLMLDYLVLRSDVYYPIPSSLAVGVFLNRDYYSPTDE